MSFVSCKFVMKVGWGREGLGCLSVMRIDHVQIWDRYFFRVLMGGLNWEFKCSVVIECATRIDLTISCCVRLAPN